MLNANQNVMPVLIFLLSHFAYSLCCLSRRGLARCLYLQQREESCLSFFFIASHHSSSLQSFSASFSLCQSILTYPNLQRVTNSTVSEGSLPGVGEMCVCCCCCCFPPPYHSFSLLALVLVVLLIILFFPRRPDFRFAFACIARGSSVISPATVLEKKKVVGAVKVRSSLICAVFVFRRDFLLFKIFFVFIYKL